METTTAQKYKTGPAMKLPETKQPPPAAPPKPVAAGDDDPWRPMDSAPRDGSYIFLKGDLRDETNEFLNEWYFYKTRQFRKGCWQETGWWRRRFGPNCAPSFTPEGWRSVKEGMPR